MNPQRLVPAQAAVVVVDMQERLLPVIHEGGRVIAQTRLMMRAAKALDLPILTTTQYAKGLGPTHPDLSRNAFAAMKLSEAISEAAQGASGPMLALRASKLAAILHR